jgi:multicomponent Na+:H+ antiporter subunit G
MTIKLLIDWTTAIFLFAGTLFMFLGALGILRMPDIFMRMQHSAKASTAGIIFTYLAVAIDFGLLDITIRVLLVILFIFITVPISTHLLARAVYYKGEKLWKNMVIDEMHNLYNENKPEEKGE